MCPEAGVIIEHMSNTIERNGGSGLIIDYGKDGPSGNSLRVRILGCVCYGEQEPLHKIIINTLAKRLEICTEHALHKCSA